MAKCDGNVGFYEIGCMATPIEAGYSVLGWNRPGTSPSSSGLSVAILPSGQQWTIKIFAVLSSQQLKTSNARLRLELRRENHSLLSGFEQRTTAKVIQRTFLSHSSHSRRDHQSDSRSSRDESGQWTSLRCSTLSLPNDFQWRSNLDSSDSECRFLLKLL